MTLIDTDVLIDAGRGVQKAIECLNDVQAKSTLIVSAVTEMELIVGCRDGVELQKLDKFLQSFQIVRINDAISTKGTELLRRYRLSHGLLIADSLIAATALTLNLPLISRNQHDYRFIAGLNLLPPPY